MPNSLLCGRRVLVVEDEMLVLMAAEDMLADLGCDMVSGAATVDQALGMIVRQFFDVAMLDINLNGDKSFPVADALVAHSVPFFFASGYGPHGLSTGYRDHPILMKPSRTQDLVDMLTGRLVN